MPWDWLLGHQPQVEMFRAALQEGRLASTFLFIGPAGVGKRQFAIELAKALLCENNPEEAFESCGHCPSCTQVAANTHPDVLHVARGENDAFLPIELFVGDRDHRMRAGLCHDISLKPFSGRRKIAIIDDADYFSQESANCLLKTLEEPPPGSVLIMLGASEQKQLQTIRSRSQVIRFLPLATEHIEELLRQRRPDLTTEAAQLAASQADGSLMVALWFCDPDVRDFRDELYDALADPRCDTVELAKSLTAFVESTGTDGHAKRARMRQIARLASMFYRELLLHLTAATPASDARVLRAAQWTGGEEVVVNCLDRCVLAETQVDANVNAGNWIEAFVDAIARISFLAAR